MEGNPAQLEAARKLIGNHSMVVSDVCNPNPKMQTDLKRLSPDCLQEVDKMMVEVAGRLFGRRGATKGAQVTVWKDTAAYLAKRTQSTNQQCPGRNADFSEQAAAAFLAAVKEVASDASV